MPEGTNHPKRTGSTLTNEQPSANRSVARCSKRCVCRVFVLNSCLFGTAECEHAEPAVATQLAVAKMCIETPQKTSSKPKYQKTPHMP